MKPQLQLAQEKIASAVRPVSFSGAGLSAESGIATFRSHDEDGLWSRFDPMKLASQQGFQADPSLVIQWYSERRRTLARARPNAAHQILGQQDGWLHITQNVDNLLESGGVAADQVLHLHGTLLRDHCNAHCGFSEAISLTEPPGLRHCPACGQWLRPSVVWFGEALPESVFERATRAVVECDLLLVVGTSAQVYPAAGLIDVAGQNGADVIVVNIDAGDSPPGSCVTVEGRAADVLPSLFNTTDSC